MTDDIEYLRGLGGDLRAAAMRAEANPRHRGWLVVAAAMTGVGGLVVAIVLATSQLTTTSHRPTTQPRVPLPAPTASTLSHPPALGGPAPIPRGPQLVAVSASAPNDVWAVGQRSSYDDSLIEHYDGTSWEAAPHPNVRRLIGVAAISSDDVWAISEYQILHWDGTSWSRVHYPEPPGDPEGVEFAGISGTGPDDVWIAGDRSSPLYGKRHNQAGSLTLALHWNGTAWRRVATPNASERHDRIAGVDAISPTDAWLVGGAGQRHTVSTTFHWNGSTWRRVPSPSDSRHNGFWGVGDDGVGGVWAVGNSGARYLKWTGTTWQPVAGPQRGTALSPTVMAGASPHDLWAAGSEQRSEFMLTHSTGGAWSSADVTLPGGATRSDSELAGITAIATDDVWTVGWWTTESGGEASPRLHPLVLHWDGTTWSPVTISVGGG